MILVEAAIVRIRGSADFYLGLLARAAGRSSDAIGHLEAALADHERLTARPLAARTRFELALALLDSGRPDDLSRARVLLHEAHAAATSLGMTALLSGASAIIGPRGPPLRASSLDAATFGPSSSPVPRLNCPTARGCVTSRPCWRDRLSPSRRWTWL